MRLLQELSAGGAVTDAEIEQEIVGDRMGKGLRWEALVKILLALAFGLAGVASPRLVGAAYAMQIATTTIADTVYHADGTAAAGTVIINWPTFTTTAGEVIQGGSQTTTIGTGGALSVNLVPNVGATPIGSYYTAVYHLDDGSVQKEYWVVPVSLGTVTIAAVKNTVLPTSVAMQTVSKSYVDTAIAAAVTGHPLDSTPYVLKAGDTMTGPLVLPADPVSSNQAADKHYVDTSVASATGGIGGKVSLVPSTTQVVTQPAGTDLEVNRLNGVESASQYATVPNSNGIANATTAADCTGAVGAGQGCLVTVEPTVNGTEIYTNKANWADRTHVKDLRLGGQHDTYLNPLNPLNYEDLVGEGVDVTQTTSSQGVSATTGSENVQMTGMEVKHSVLAGGGNLFSEELGSVPYFKTNYVGVEVLGVYNTAGQHVLNELDTSCYAVGDCLIGSQFLHSMGGFRDSGDEGTHPYDIEVLEDQRVYTATCATGCTTGSQSLTAGSQTWGGTQGDGRYLIDTNPSGVISAGSLTGGSAGTIHATATFTGSSFPVSTFFQTAALIPSQSNNSAPGTVTVAIATTGLPAGFSSNTAAAPSSSGVACVAAQSSALPNHEMVPYTVVDGTHLSMTFLKPHGAGSTIAIGGLCGYGLEQRVDTKNGIRQLFPVIGSYSSTGLYYASGATQIVGVTGVTSAYANFNYPIVSAVRSGNVVTLTLSGTTLYDENGLTMTVSGVTDSSYNGSFAVTTTGASTLTYADAGPDSTSSGGTVAYVTGGYALYPMAEVLSVYNPATKSVDGTFTLAPNTVAWAVNDPLEQPHYFQALMSGDTTIVSQTMPRQRAYLSQGYAFRDNTGPGLRGFQISNEVPASSYYGNGGTHSYPDMAYESTGVWKRVLDAQAGETSVFSLHCNSKGCNRWNSGYDLFEMDSSAGVDTVNYAPQSSTVLMNLRGANYSFSPLAFTAGTANITTLNATTVNAGAINLGAVTASSVTASTLSGSLSASNVTSGMLPAGVLPVMGASGSSHAVGAVPDPGSTAGTTRYLREDGTWVSPPGSAGGVSSFNGRTGALTASSGDYTVGQVTGAAPLASPALTGTATLNGTAFGSLSTATQSLAGTGAAVPTGPSSVATGDLVTYTGTAGQQADSGIFSYANTTYNNFGLGHSIGVPTTGTTTGGAQFGDRNTIVGVGACGAITTARENICIGPGALASFTGLVNDNVNVDMIENGLNNAVGSYALSSLLQTPWSPPGGGGPYQSQDTSAFGQKAGINLTGASSSNFFGNHTCTACTQALNTNIIGSHSVQDGTGIMGVQYTADVNVFGSQSWNASGNKSNINSMGAFVAPAATTANNIDVVGDAALPNCTTCSYDEIMGSGTGTGIVAGAQNVVIGGKAGPRTTDYSSQILLGYETCYSCSTLTTTTIVGFEAAAFDSGTLTSVTALGSTVMQSATGNLSNDVLIGDQTGLHISATGGGSNGNQNVWVGSKAFNNATTLNNSLGLGNQVGGGNTLTGTNLICLGSSSCNALTSSESNDIAIGQNATPGVGLSGAQQYGSGTNSVANSVQFNGWGSITGLAGTGPLWQTAIKSGTPTYTAGTNITSVTCASGYTCDNRRGELTIVAGSGASSGTIATVNFSATLAAAPGGCMVTQNGGATMFSLGHGTPATTGFTVTAGVSVASATLTVDYRCEP